MHWPKCSDQSNKDEDTSLDNSWNNENTSFRNFTQGWLVGFYGISTFEDYLMPNPFLYKEFYFKQFSLA